MSYKERERFINLFRDRKHEAVVGFCVLGGMFSAPIEALKSFTLVEWTTNSGLEVSLNVFMIVSAVIGLSLFIWFLKLFSGG